jgi:DNA-binding protein H-NS
MADAPNLETMSIDDLWELHQKVGEVLEAKIKAEKQELDRRLISLHPLENQTRVRRPYPPVVPKFANPDAPEEVWSGRGRMPRWVTEKLSSGVALADLSIVPLQGSIFWRRRSNPR